MICLFETFKVKSLGTEMLCKSLDSVWMLLDNLWIDQSRQESYADRRFHPFSLRLVIKLFFKYHP